MRNVPNQRDIQTDQRIPQRVLSRQALLQSCRKLFLVCITTVNICTRVQTIGNALRRSVCKMVCRKDIANSTTIARHPLVLAQFKVIPQHVLEQEGARTRRDAVDSVVAAHHGRDLGIAYAGLERGSVELAEVLLGNDGIK